MATDPSIAPAESFTQDENRANRNPLAGTFPPSLATLREHRGMAWGDVRRALTAQIPASEQERLIAEGAHWEECERRRS